MPPFLEEGLSLRQSTKITVLRVRQCDIWIVCLLKIQSERLIDYVDVC